MREEKDYHSGKNLILVQLRLEDTLLVQTRAYTKIAEILSRIGGYMQLMNTVFLLVTSIVNRLYSEIKIINSIFNFYVKENKMILKLRSFKTSTKAFNLNNDKKKFCSSNIITNNNMNNIENDNKSKNNLILKDNTINNNIYSLNSLNNKKNNEIQNYTIKNNNNPKIIVIENTKNDSFKSGNENIINQRRSNNLNSHNFRILYDINKEENYTDYNDYISLTIFDFLCIRKKSKKYRYIKLYNKGNSFYRNKMDIVNVFIILTLIEDYLKK